MKLIPDSYQELDNITQAASAAEAKCMCFLSPGGGKGVSSLTMSIAARLHKTSKRVLVLDLNQYHPMSEQLPLIGEHSAAWRFDNISSQLNISEHSGVHFLSVTELDDKDVARDPKVVREAFHRWQQEFDIIMVDLSPLLRVNQHNIPSRVFADASDINILVAAVGSTTEESLVSANQRLTEEGFKNVNIVLSQTELPPLGPKLLAKIDTLSVIPSKLRVVLKNALVRQAWLFRPIGV